MTERLVVIGADAAGMSAASQARRLRTPDDLEIVAFERGTVTSYAACGIPYWVAGLIERRDELVARTPEQFRKADIEVKLRHEVVEIDPDEMTVAVRDLDGGTLLSEPYDELLVATGATPIRPPLPGIDADGVFGIQTLDDGQAVIEALAGTDDPTVVVIGAGYIGIEMAEAMCLRGITVHVVEQASWPMPTFDEECGQQIAEAIEATGIKLHLETAAEAIETGDDGRAVAVVTSQGSIACDLVVLGLGTRPNSDLARDAGIEIGPSGGIVTDRTQRTPTRRVWAAGDCAQTQHRVTGQPVAIALGTIANKQGRIAGRNLGGLYATFPGVLGTAVTQLCGIEMARTGLTQQEAAAAGLVGVTATMTSTTRAHYYPDAKPITIKLVAERQSGCLLGAQIVGEEGAAKRIDVLATAIWNNMTVEDLSQVDLSYAPPFSPVWDPVLMAARQAATAVEQDYLAHYG